MCFSSSWKPIFEWLLYIRRVSWLCFSNNFGCRHADFTVSNVTHFNFIATKRAAVLGNAKSICSVVFVLYCYIMARTLHEVHLKLILFFHVMKDWCVA